MTTEEWKQRCAARYKAVAGLTQEQSDQAAKAAYDTQFGKFAAFSRFDCTPEECADVDMSYWES